MPGGVYVCRGLHVFQLSKHLPLAYVIAFFHVKVHDLAHGVGADVHKRLGPYLARGRNLRRQFLTRKLCPSEPSTTPLRLC